MTNLFVQKEESPSEPRVAITPQFVSKFVQLGLKVQVEADAGCRSEYLDQNYVDAGATIVNDRQAAVKEADILLRVQKPQSDEIQSYKQGALCISFLNPFQEKDLLKDLAKADVNTVSLEMIPRTTLAQKMDALSSQSNLAGYAAVILAAKAQKKILPMMMTPAGTISPTRFFIIGVGVAGLQAIATAKRLGARVEAFDTRPVVEEQVKSLGAKFVKIDLGETGQTAQGYAKELTPEQLEIQRKGMADACARADVVITTAKLFGRPAPRILTRDILDRMESGSVVVDLAAESGGNVEGSEPGQEIRTEKGVRILGPENLEGTYAYHASQMLSANFYHFIEHFWDTETNKVNYDLQDEILKGCLITHEGKVVHPLFQ